ncbi:MAG: hypothetical protein ACK53Y_08625, partial [bacterium]
MGAHHQNGIAEKRIGDLQRRATTSLLHAQRRWPDAINTHLWPYAIRCANETRNTCPTKTSCEHTRILGALVEHPQGNLEEIQQENPAEHPRG